MNSLEFQNCKPDPFFDEKKIAALGEVFYTTAGNATSVENAERFGKEIAQDIRSRYKEKVAMILTAT